MEKQRVIAVDFDGCLCDNAYPDIGAPNWQVIDAALKERADGAALILWTCREGDMLQQALDACKGWGLEFDAVNDSLTKWKETWKNDPRKIGATEYWDDKAVRMPNIDPVTAAAEALGMSPARLRELAQAEKARRLLVLPCSEDELQEMLENLLSVGAADEIENYTSGYRNGYRNGRIELLKYLLQIREAAEAAPEEREAEHDR